MTDYYMQIRKGGAWHIRRSNDWFTRCGIPAQSRIDARWPHLIDHFFLRQRDKPQQPLCKRCERIAEKR